MVFWYSEDPISKQNNKKKFPEDKTQAHLFQSCFVNKPNFLSWDPQHKRDLLCYFVGYIFPAIKNMFKLHVPHYQESLLGLLSWIPWTFLCIVFLLHFWNTPSQIAVISPDNHSRPLDPSCSITHLPHSIYKIYSIFPFQEDPCFPSLPLYIPCYLASLGCHTILYS